MLILKLKTVMQSMTIRLSPTWQRAEQVKYSSGKEVWAKEVTPEEILFVIYLMITYVVMN